ncbi:MAG TPA: hypothetical protein VLT59_06035 [Steroidobacteraceae bacterium]|nr:hypothetical protein [Steroidobacteraceae bacterium]
MTRKSLFGAVSVLAGLTLSASMTVHAADKPTFSGDAQDCAQIVWRADILEKYPKIDLACDDVVERGGKRYVKFRGTVDAQTKDGVKITFPRTGYATEVKVADKNKEVFVDGKARKLGQLKGGDTISVYVPSDRFVVSFLDERIVELGEGTLGQ